jgi:hypothetical protein
MPNSLKDATRKSLLVVMIANLAIFYAALKTNALFGGDLLALTTDWLSALPAGFGVIITGILNAQLGSEAKARIVFWRWHDPLPGCQAFSHHASTDPRVDVATIGRLHGPLPSDPKQQNALWYRLYQTVRDDPAVTQVHRHFLFTRDYACLAFTFLIILGPLGFIQIASTRTATLYFVLLVGQYASGEGRGRL